MQINSFSKSYHQAPRPVEQKVANTEQAVASTTQDVVEKQGADRGEKLIFGTYNVRNMFDGIPNKGGNKGRWKERRTSEKQMKALASVIKESKAEVIALQEVENKAMLQEFVDNHLGGDFQVVLEEGNDRRGIDVAFITKHEITDVKSHKDHVVKVGNREDKFSRDFLRVDMKIKGYPMSFFSAHLKSHHGGDVADVKRAAEATAIRDILAQEMGDFETKNFVVMGDFNDREGTKTTDILEFGRSDNDPRLNDSLEGKSFEERDTYPWSRQEYRGQLDHIYYPDHMKDNIVSSYTMKHPPTDKIASDHRMVVAEMYLSDDLNR